MRPGPISPGPISPVRWEMSQCSLAICSGSVKCIMQICSKDVEQYFQKNSIITTTEVPEIKVQKHNLKYEDSASSWGNKNFYVLQKSYPIIVKTKQVHLGRRNSQIILLLFAEVLRYVICWMAWDNFNSRAIDLKIYLKDSSYLTLFLLRLMFCKVD